MDLGKERKTTSSNPLHKGPLLGALVLALSIFLCSTSVSISAAAPAPFGDFCHFGSAAGQCYIPRGVATSPLTGHIYLADQVNQRVDEFSVWGNFIRSWGWGVRTGASELQTCTAETSCRRGLSGSGPGQLAEPQGIAVDSAGNVFVVDWLNHRVEKFDSEGHFLLMFGGGVDQGPNHPGNVCTSSFLAEGDTCGAGTTGTGSGQFSANWGIGSFVAVGPEDQVYVGDENRIQIFDTSGAYQGQLPLPHPGVVGSLAVDPNTGNLYMAYPNARLVVEAPETPNVYRLDQSTGAVLQTLEVDKPAALAVDGSGRVYVFDQFFGEQSTPGNHGTRVLVFAPNGALQAKFAEAERNSEAEVESSTGIATGEACFSGSAVGVYLSEFGSFNFVRTDALHAYGSPDPTKCPPPQVPPSLDGQFATSVDMTSAILKAEINPHYFTESVGTTTYYVQSGSAACIEAEGWSAECVSTQPVPPATLEAVPGNEDVTSGGVVLGGLSPGTEYRYRFVVESTGAPGEPVVGVGGKPGVEGASASFTTMPQPSPPAACPNDAFRAGAGGSLPDCRAYEMVSPIEKEGGDALARLNIVPFEARMDQSAASGDALTFSAYRAFQNPKSAPFSSQYLSRRDPAAGWGTDFISPPQEGEAFISQLLPVDNLYRAFTEELGIAWLQTDTEPLLGPGGLAGRPNIYRRENAAGTYSACTSAPPLLSEELNHGPQLQGFSNDGHMAVFRTENKLTPDGSNALRETGSKIYQLYACSYEGGVASIHLVSKLPGTEAASGLENTVGGPANESFALDQGRTESLENAVSDDGTKVFWTASVNVDAIDPGALYVRLNPAAEPSGGPCVGAEPAKACTLQISAGPARFWMASKDGAIAIFSTSTGQLNEFEVTTRKTRPIAVETLGVAGASADAARVYFVSRAALAAGATPGSPNLYVHDAGSKTTTFIATLSEEDLTQDDGAPGPVNPEPAFHTARVTPDGGTAVFMSSSPQLAQKVAGYDNTDQQSRKPAAEIYRYSIGAGLACISCNRTGARPRGREIQNPHLNAVPIRFAASLLPPWLNSLYAPRVLSNDGKRIYFESFEALTSADTNEKADVYEWEQAGAGSCSESDSSFDPASGGCVTLITSGKEPTDSQFVDASPNGRDVFIRTASSLVSWDPGQIDIYDAREGGGFPAPPQPPPECEGEACQSPPPAPEAPTPASSSYTGPGNLKKPSSKACRKGHHKTHRKGKVVCVKNHKKQQHKSGRVGR